jgi:hypothetical protein
MFDAVVPATSDSVAKAQVQMQPCIQNPSGLCAPYWGISQPYYYPQILGPPNQMSVGANSFLPTPVVVNPPKQQQTPPPVVQSDTKAVAQNIPYIDHKFPSDKKGSAMIPVINEAGTKCKVTLASLEEEHLLAWLENANTIPMWEDGHKTQVPRSEINLDSMNTLIRKKKTIPHRESDGAIKYIPNPQYKG